MKEKIVVVDYSRERLARLTAGLRARFADIEVRELRTQPPEDNRNTDSSELAELRANVYDILICRIGGNPSGYECLKTFKKSNPKGRAILYTRSDMVQLDQFERLKLANALFQSIDDGSRVFANADQLFDVVDRVRKEAGLVRWTSPFKDKAVLGTVIPLATATLGLIAAVVKLLGG
jgi:hypothetical protein